MSTILIEHRPPPTPQGWLDLLVDKWKAANFIYAPSDREIQGIRDALEAGFRQGWRAASQKISDDIQAAQAHE